MDDPPAEAEMDVDEGMTLEQMLQEAGSRTCRSMARRSGEATASGSRARASSAAAAAPAAASRRQSRQGKKKRCDAGRRQGACELASDGRAPESDPEDDSRKAKRRRVRLV